MAELQSLAEIRIWGQTVGAVYEPEGAPPVFEYAREFRRSGLELSPARLPLSTEGPVQFPELGRSAAFEGLPGLLADALPDRFGNAVIAKYFSEIGRPEAALSPVQKLLYIGNRAMGALSFHPAHGVPQTRRNEEALEIASLVEAARRVVEGSTDVVVPELMRLSASAGGARAKAIVLFDPARGEMRSAFAKRRPGDQDWILKFDGVGELGSPAPESRPYNRIEYAYSLVAREAGIEMAETRLLEERGLAHFMTRRFDREGDKRIHMHSLGGMEHVDYNIPGLYSYEQLFRRMLALGLPHPELEQAFLRMLFNLVLVNQDDHVKNIAFLMDPSGTWRLAPAYDLTYAAGQGYTRLHQMSVAGKRENLSAADIHAIAKQFRIRRAPRLAAQLRAALSHWPEHCDAAGLPPTLLPFRALLLGSGTGAGRVAWGRRRWIPLAPA